MRQIIGKLKRVQKRVGALGVRQRGGGHGLAHPGHGLALTLPALRRVAALDACSSGWLLYHFGIP